MAYANGQIPLSALFPVEGAYFDEDTARRMHWLISELRFLGVSITITEGYRPLGVPADRNITDASKTSTGGSNQWFQKGREDRGETPSAAIPGTSIHGLGRAADCDFAASQRALVHEKARQVGMVFTIGSEPWHMEAIGPVLLPAGALDVTPITEPISTEEQEMALLDGGYIAELNDKGEFTRGMIFGPGVPGGVIVKSATNIAELQAMGNIAGVRVFNPEDGKGRRVGAPLKYVKKAEFDATVELAKQIFAES